MYSGCNQSSLSGVYHCGIVGVMLTAWVIGSQSFIGKHLVKRLRDRGIKVVEYGRYEMSDSDGFDIPAGVDYIYNLAAAGSKKGDYSDWDMFWTNVHQLFELLMESKDVSYKAFIQFGTSSEYGIKDSSMREDDVLHPNFMYAATKASATQLARAFAVEYGKPVVTVRPFTVYGPGMQGTKLIPTLLKKIQAGQPIDLVGGNHDYIYIEDFLDALEVVVSFSEELKGLPVNIGTGVQTSNHQLVSLVGDLVGRVPVVNEVSNLRGHGHHQVDSPIWKANINTLKLFGWRPQYTLRDGLRLMYEKQGSQA